jgi:hypothetical protein
MKKRPTRSEYVFLQMGNMFRRAEPKWTDVEPGQARAFHHSPDRDARQVHSLSAV